MPTAASGGRLRAGRRTARPDTRPYARLRSTPMTILEHDYGIPSEDELARLVGAATPHFALQIRDRVRAYADALPEAHPRRAGIANRVIDDIGDRAQQLFGVGQHRTGVRCDQLHIAAAVELVKYSLGHASEASTRLYIQAAHRFLEIPASEFVGGV